MFNTIIFEFLSIALVSVCEKACASGLRDADRFESVGDSHRRDTRQDRRFRVDPKEKRSHASRALLTRWNHATGLIA